MKNLSLCLKYEAISVKSKNNENYLLKCPMQDGTLYFDGYSNYLLDIKENIFCFKGNHCKVTFRV